MEKQSGATVNLWTFIKESNAGRKQIPKTEYAITRGNYIDDELNLKNGTPNRISRGIS